MWYIRSAGWRCKMDDREIYDAAKSNSIRKLLRAKKEIHEIYSAKSIMETMYLNDIVEFEKIMYRAEQIMGSML